jgi:hypothetical protein
MFPLDVIKKKRQEIDALEAEWLAMVREYDRAGEWRADGYLSAAAALRDACKMTTGTAAAHVKLAAKLEQLPDVADAFAQGELSRQHAWAIADAYTSERAAELVAITAVLVDAAKNVNPKDLRSLVKHATDAIDADGGAADDNAKHDRRQLYTATTLSGMLDVAGTIDALAGQWVVTALETEMQRDHRAGDTRSLPQRRADAVVNICRQYLDRGERNTPGALPHVMFIADIGALADTTVVNDLRNEATRTGALSRATLEQLACDCLMTRVLMAGQSEVLDVGRATRVISPALRKAVVARDKTCTEPGCNVPADKCEIHHEIPWSEGGATDLGNLKAKCGGHHWKKHHPERPPPRRR